jgi:hypothetical protein
MTSNTLAELWSIYVTTLCVCVCVCVCVYIEQCVTQRHRMDTERHKLILLFFKKRFSDFEI